MRGRQALVAGLAVSLTAGAAWLGISAATAGGEQAARGGSDRVEYRGWPTAGVTSAARATKSADRGRTLTVVAVEDRAADVDLGATGESVGDFFVFEETLYAPNGGREVGKDAVRCELGIRTLTCEGTFRLDGRGKITVAGAFFGEWDAVIPVTGGTRDFAGVGGQLRVVNRANSTLLEFRLIG